LIRKTTNGGTSFSELSGSGIGSPRQLWFLNDTTGYLINSEGDVFRTSNGSTFEPAGATCLQTPFDFYCINDSTCFAVGSFTNATCDVSFTVNRGQTWTDLTFPYAYAGWGVHALDTSAIWLVGQNQTIIRRGTGDLVTQVSQSESNQETVSVWPNPGKEFVYFQSSRPISNWQILDLSGRLVMHGQSLSASVEHLPQGLYFIRFHLNNGEEKSARWIKQ
jgi:hypothetical protein